MKYSSTTNKERSLPKPLYKSLESSNWMDYKQKYFIQYIIERKQKSLAWMCNQDKAFSNAYDKQYASKKVIDLAKKRSIIMDKISNAIKGKGQMIDEEEALFKKQQMQGTKLKLLSTTIKVGVEGQIDDRVVFDKYIAYIKELERKLVEDNERKRKKQEKKDVALDKKLEKEDAPTKKKIIKKRKAKSSKKLIKEPRRVKNYQRSPNL